jgi:hypothetical protein
MVIDNLNRFCACILPDKANAPLVVDTYAVLPHAISLQRFQSIAGRGHQVSQLACLMNLAQLALRGSLDILR